MKRIFRTGILLFWLAGAVAAQSAAVSSPTAPVVWKRYTDPELKISFESPKPPVRMIGGDPCQDVLTHSFFAYAQRSVYELVIHEKWGKGGREFCSQKSSFDAKRYFESLRSNAGDSVKINQDTADRFDTESAGGSERVVLNRKRRLVAVLRVHHNAAGTSTVPKFFDSLDFTGDKVGEGIGGVERIIGDTSDEVIRAEAADQSGTSIDYRIIVSPRAQFPAAERRSEVQGTVRLKIMLLANGTIGPVQVVTALPGGFTEAAIAAARRIVFIPKIAGGKNMSVFITRDYSFKSY